MTEELMAKLEELETDLRALAGSASSANLNISIDAHGTNFSYSITGEGGTVDNVSKRVPRTV